MNRSFWRKINRIGLIFTAWVLVGFVLTGCGKAVSGDGTPAAGDIASDDPLAQYIAMQPIKRDAAIGQQAVMRKDFSDVTITDLYEACPMTDNPNDVLCVPTQMTKVGDDYFLVDCYHNRILTSRDVSAPLTSWKVLTDRIQMGHTIAGDGRIYLADDTENNSVLVFRKDGDQFFQIQTVEGVGKRPHFICYLEDLKQFWCLSSLTGEFYIFETVSDEDGDKAVLVDVAQMEFLNEIYVRSFTPMEDGVYIPAGDGMIYRMGYDFTIQEAFPLQPELGGPTQLSKIDDTYYLTVSTDIFVNPECANLVCAKSLSNFNDGTFESVRSKFCEDGTPYVITPVDDGYYLALHSDDGSHCMWKFWTSNGEITETESVLGK